MLARGAEDVWTLSVDSSGELLHRRGWRTEAGAAPLRETLAAGVLSLAGYDPARPLLDPMCGAGTIALEAAARARGQAPGAGRRFAFERWPSFDDRTLGDGCGPRRSGAAARGRAGICAWDRDPKAIETRARQCRARGPGGRAGAGGGPAGRNARRGSAGGRWPSCARPPRGAPGLIVVNPPYGTRLGSPGRPSRLVRVLGRTLRTAFPGWRAAVLLPDARWASALGLDGGDRHPLRNGGLRVHLVVGQVGGQAAPGKT